MTTPPLVWFVTGSSRGFGRAIAQAALQVGDSVVATARRPEQLQNLVDAHGDRISPLQLDVTRSDDVALALTAGRERYGRIDVVVNNAGYANIAAIESVDDADFRAQFETNFWGVYNVSKAAIPILREQSGGLIIQFSSMGGRVGGTPGLASYQAAKFAIDGFSRVLLAEAEPFGVKVMLVEPAGFATDWAGQSMRAYDYPEIYDSTVGFMCNSLRYSEAMTAGDPQRAAEILVSVAQRNHVPFHLPLGVIAAEASIAMDEQLLAQDRAWAAVSRSADFAESYPVQLPPDA